MSQLFILYLGSLMLRSMGVAALGAASSCFTQSVARRHALWSAVLGIMILMPAVDRVLPMSQPPAPLIITMMQSATGPSAAMHAESSTLPTPAVETIAKPKHWDWWLLAAGLYGVVTILFAFQMSIAHKKLRMIRRASRRISTPLFDDPIAELRESDSLRIPITVGFLKPFVILPSDWRSWDEWKLRAVLMHELAHVRRADWIVSMLAALNTVVFWYNPLSWWLERRIGRLCEEASDEACVSGLGDPARYSEVLLQFATAHVGSRLGVGVAMARRNIASRIERILTIDRPECGVLSRTSAAIVFVLAIPVLYTMATIQAAPEGATTFALRIPAPPTLSGPASTASSLIPVSFPVSVAKGSTPRQPEHSRAYQIRTTAVRSEFEAATIKPNKVEYTGARETIGGTCRGVDTHGNAGYPLGRCVFTKVPLKWLIQSGYWPFALSASPRIVVGGPAWLDSDRWDLEGKAESAATATESALQSMLLAFLIDKFNLQFHSEPRVISGYVLSAPKGASKLTPSSDGGEFSGRGTGSLLTLKNATMTYLANNLAALLGMPVADKTNLTGSFDFVLKMPPASPTSNDPSQATIGIDAVFASVEELGLRLERQKVTVEALVIDHVDKLKD